MNKRTKYVMKACGIKKSFVSAVAGICALLLLIPMLFTSSTGADEVNSNVENTISHVRIGMKYGTSAVSNYSFTTEYGIEYGAINKQTHEFIPFGSHEDNIWTVKSENGGYFVKISYCIVGDRLLVKKNEIISLLTSVFPDYNSNTLVQYNSSDGYDVRTKGFATREGADDYIAKMDAAVEEENAKRSVDNKIYISYSVVACNKGCITLLDGEGNQVCGYSQNDAMWALGVRAVQPEDDSRVGYICNSGKIYMGVFEFRTLFDGEYKQDMTVINVVDIEKYIAACMSYEIYTSWKHESHQMFAIVVRSYVYGQLDRHSTWDFNLCTTTHCQAYKGFDRVNTSLLTAAEETKGLVVADADSHLAKVYYYASAGGCTVSAHEVWKGTEYSYLQPVATPWEDYRSSKYSSRTVWSVEYSPYKLYLELKELCPELEGSVTKIETTLADNSSHVKSVKFTDLYGNTSVVDRVTDLQNTLGLNSANFVVGKAGNTVDRVCYTLDCFDSIYNVPFEDRNVLSFDGSTVYAVSSDKEVLLEGERGQIVTSDGIINGNIFDNRLQVIMAGRDYWLTKDGLPDVLNAKTVKKVEKIQLEGSSGYFVFDGIGWGHGIGLSQYGANDMIEMGYSPEIVLRCYFPGTRIVGANTLEN